jgi:hypothetical protein
MADATCVDKYPKATNTKADVQKIQQQHLADGAKSSTLDESDPTDWILTTVWPGDC